MPKRMVNETIVLVREGKDGKSVRITPPIGKGFDFTDEELESIEGPKDEPTGSTAVSKLEKGEDVAKEDEAASETTEAPKTGAKKDTGDL